MKILLVNRVLHPKGAAESVLFTLARALNEMGHQTLFFAEQDRRNYDTPQAKYFARPISKEMSRLHRFRLRLDDRDAKDRMATLIHDEKPDAAILFRIDRRPTFSVADALRDAGVPTLMYLCDYRPLCPAGGMLRDDRLCTKCAKGHYLPCVRYACLGDSASSSAAAALSVRFMRMKHCWSKVDGLLAPSSYHQLLFTQAHFTTKPITAVDLPLSADAFAPVQVSRGAYLLHVGALRRWKGLATLLRALTQCTCQLPLYVAGDGDDKAALMQLTERLGLTGRVHFLGQRPAEEVRRLMAECQCLIAPSECEEIAPFALLEAQAMGKVCIVSNMGVLPDRIAADHTGLIFTAGDSLSLAEAIDELAAMPDDTYFRMGEAARTDALQRYAPEAFARRILAQLPTPQPQTQS